MCIYTVYYIHIKWFWCYILYEFNWIYMICVAHCRFHNCGWLWPSKIIGLVPLHDFLQAFHRFGHHIGHFLRSGAPLGFDLQQATHFRNPRLMMNLMPSTHLALRKKWSVAECFRPTAGFVGDPRHLSNLLVYVLHNRAHHLLWDADWQLTDPKFLSLMAFNHCMQMNDQYIYNCDFWSMIKSNCLQPDPGKNEIHSRD